MSVIVVILKILGMILLAVTGILLFLLLLLLLYPIGYQFEGQSEGKWTMHGSVSWLLHAVTFHFIFDGAAFDTQWKLFGIQMGRNRRTKQDISANDGEEEAVHTAHTAEEEAVHTAHAAGEEAVHTAHAAEDTDKYIPIETPDGRKQHADALRPHDSLPAAKERHTCYGETQKSTHKRERSCFRRIASAAEYICRLFHRISAAAEHIRGLLHKIPSTAEQVRRTLHNTAEKGKRLLEFLGDESNKRAFSCIRRELLYLLKHMRFRKLKAKLEFSAGDPARTGQALGVLSIMPFLYRYQVEIFPDFESDKLYVSGNVKGKGHFRLLHLLISVIRLLLHEECRGLLAQIRQ